MRPYIFLAASLLCTWIAGFAVGCSLGPDKKDIDDIKAMGDQVQTEVSGLRKSLDRLSDILEQRLPETDKLEEIADRMPQQDSVDQMTDSLDQLSDRISNFLEEWKKSPFGSRGK